MAVLDELRPPRGKAVPARWDWSRVAATVTLLAYGSLIAVVVSRHEPWFDEAQAWLIARDSTLLELFRVLPYEGQPGLWHLLLMLPARLLPYASLNWISAALGTVAVWFFLRRSPFPTAIKILLPFTYFVFYQYGVVARNYALLPLLLFLIAAAYPHRHTRPARFALLLFLLANTSTHGYLIAGSLLAIQAVEVLASLKKGSGRPERAQVLSTILLALAMAGLAAVMMPPEDRTFAAAGIHWNTPSAVLGTAVSMLKTSTADNWFVLAGALVASLWFFRRRRVLHLYLVPTVSLLALFGFVHNAPWHEGVLFLVWLVVLWVGLAKEVPADTAGDRSRKAALAALAVVCAFQVYWSVRTAVLDFENPYSGSEALASYIKDQNLEEKTIFGYHWASIALNPYFERNIYDNYNPPGRPSYWLWSERNHMVQDFELIEALQPDYVVFPIKVSGSEKIATRRLPSYRPEAIFPGEMYWKGWVLQPEVYMLFRRDR